MSATSRWSIIRFRSSAAWPSRRSSIRATSRRSTAAKFALAYFAELQAVPGFEVVPLGVVGRGDHAEPHRSVVPGRGAAAGEDPGRRRGRDRRGHRLLRPTIRRGAACGSNGTRRTRASTKFRPATACRGARRRKSSFPRRWCSKPRWRWPARRWRRKRRPATRRDPPNSGQLLPLPETKSHAVAAVRSRPARQPNASGAGTEGSGNERSVAGTDWSEFEDRSARQECAAACEDAGDTHEQRNGSQPVQPECRACPVRLVRPVRSAQAARCRPIGRTSVASFRRRRARCGRRACRTMVRL